MERCFQIYFKYKILNITYLLFGTSLEAYFISSTWFLSFSDALLLAIFCTAFVVDMYQCHCFRVAAIHFLLLILPKPWITIAVDYVKTHSIIAKLSCVNFVLKYI